MSGLKAQGKWPGPIGHVAEAKSLSTLHHFAQVRAFRMTWEPEQGPRRTEATREHALAKVGVWGV